MFSGTGSMLDEKLGPTADLPSVKDRVRAEPLYIEVSPLLTRHLTGIGRFAARLIEALSRWTPLRLFTCPQGEPGQSVVTSNALRVHQEIAVNARELPAADGDVRDWTRRLFFRPLQPFDEVQARRSAALYTMLRSPQRMFQKEICLLHDFTPALMPAAHTSTTQTNFAAFFLRYAALCDAVIANSRSTKFDAAWLSTLEPGKVAVGYPGPSLCLRRHAHDGPVKRERNFVLVVSTLEPRKNGRFLFEWFLRTRALDPAMELRWVGPSGWLVRLPERSRQFAGRRQKIRFLGVVSDRRLCELYRQAAFTLYPSLYEGFGFPVLDALRHGARVVCSYNSSLKEFAGPGVHYFDACDAATLDQACRDVLACPSAEISREDLDLRFSWKKLARRVLKLAGLRQPVSRSSRRANGFQGS